jgi:hypothetical protein
MAGALFCSAAVCGKGSLLAMLQIRISDRKVILVRIFTVSNASANCLTLVTLAVLRGYASLSDAARVD